MSETQETMHRLAPSYRRLGRLVLRICDGPNSGNTFILDTDQGRRFTGGRNEVHDVTLHDEHVSQTHFELRLGQDGQIVLRDLESTNGIVAGGFCIREAVVEPGARFLVGHSVLELSAADQVEVPISNSNHFGAMFGECEAMREVFQILKGIASTDLAKRVLVIGETGTGKELVARGIHDRSSRRERPFVVFDCTGVPRDLVQAKLFGHTRDAYTGARKDRLGCFRAAHGGTLFIDEIGELPLEIQPMLLRALETGEINPLGEERVHRVNVRVITATHRDLRKMVAAERFRQDLYYRLRGVRVELPPLRERGDDICCSRADSCATCPKSTTSRPSA
jgi:hypothetical protein